MADNIANILMRITGESNDADDTLAAFLGKLKAFGNEEATAEADVNVSGAAKLTALGAQLAKFDKARAIAHADVNVQTASLTKAFAEVRTFSEQHVKPLVIPVDVDEDLLQFKMDRVARSLRDFKPTGKQINIPVDVDDGVAITELSALDATIKRLDGRKIKIQTDLKEVTLAGLAMAKLGLAFADIGAAGAKVAGSIGGVTVNLGAFGVKLTATTGAILALVVAMGVSLVAAASLLVTALAGATAAVGALATAFVGALGPAVAVAIAAVTRITKIVQVLKAKNAADKANAAGTKEAAQAEERRRDALVAVGQAARAVDSAERSLSQAREGAKAAITQANRDEAAANRQAIDAAKNLRTETVNAYDAMASAAENVRRAILGVADAQQGIDDSKTALKRAQFELKQLRKEAGLAGNELNDSFKKFEDIDFKFNDKGFASLAKGATGSGTSSAEEQQIKLEEAVNRVRDAKLDERHATDGLEDAEKALNKRRKESADFAREGINAFEPYTQALRANQDATVRLADATARANALQKQGVDNAPAVIAAQESLTSAHVRLVEARHNAARAAEGAAGGAAARKATDDWNALTAAEQLFALALSNAGTAITTSFRPAVEGVLAGIGSLLSQIPAIITPLKAQFASLGVAIGDAFGNFGLFLADPSVNAQLGELVNGATQLAAILGTQAFQNFSQLMLNLATASMPLLIDATKRLSMWLGSLADKTSDTDKLSASINSLGGFLWDVLGFVKALGRVFLSFFSATGSQSKGFLKTITDMTNRLADFLGSDEGRKQLRDFFRVMIPLAVETFKFIGQALIFIIQVIEILAPALTGLLSAFNLLLGIVNGVLNILKPFLQIAAQVALLFLGGLPKGIALVIEKFRVLKFFLGGIVGFMKSTFASVFTTIIGRFASLATFFPELFAKIKDIIVNFVTGDVKNAFAGVLDIIKWPFEQALKWIKELGPKFFHAGKEIFNMLIDGIKSVTGKVGGIVKKGLNLMGDLLPGSEPKDKSSPLAGLKARGAAIMENLAAGIPVGADQLSVALHRSLVPVVGNIDTSVAVPRARTPVGATAGSRGAVGATENHFHIEAPAGQLPDAEATVRAIARRMERKGGSSPRA